MYVSPNYRTKKALRSALVHGVCVEVYQPGIGTVPANGVVGLEGPHYPEPHRWYAQGIMEKGRLISVS